MRFLRYYPNIIRARCTIFRFGIQIFYGIHMLRIPFPNYLFYSTHNWRNINCQRCALQFSIYALFYAIFKYEIFHKDRKTSIEVNEDCISECDRMYFCMHSLPIVPAYTIQCVPDLVNDLPILFLYSI